VSIGPFVSLCTVYLTGEPTAVNIEGLSDTD